MREAIQYAWHGSGKRWDALPIQALGGGVGGVAFWYWGVKVPQQILDNPGLGAVLAIAIGGIAGVVAAFLLRLCWWPLHKRLKKTGGLRSTLSVRLGDNMWPVLLMVAGICAFVILFGAGAILYLVQSAGPTSNGNKPYAGYEQTRKLEAIDSIRDILNSKVRPLGMEAVTFQSHISDMLRGDRDVKTTETIDTLNKIADAAELYLRQIRTLRDARTEYRDILDRVQFEQPDNPNELVNSARNLANDIRSLAPGSDPTYLFKTHSYQLFVKSSQGIGSWASYVNSNLLFVRNGISPEKQP